MINSLFCLKKETTCLDISLKDTLSVGEKTGFVSPKSGWGYR